jgi:hypothetical protein
MLSWLSLFPGPSPIILADDPLLPDEVCVPGGEAPAATAPAEAPADPVPVAAWAEPAPVQMTPALVPEDAFPTAAELDAIYAEASAPAPGPDLALRQEVAGLLGLDPAVAEDAAAFDAMLAALPPPGPEPDPVPVSDVAAPALDWEAMSRDWGDPSRGWILG